MSLSAIIAGLALVALGLAPAASAASPALQHNPDTVTVSWEMPEGGTATNIKYPQLELSPKLNPDAVQCGRTIQMDVYYYKTKEQKKVVDALIDGKVLDNRPGHGPSDYSVIKSWSFSQQPACQTPTTPTTPTSSTVTTPTTTVVTTTTETVTTTSPVVVTTTAPASTVTTASTATRTATETVTATSPVVVTTTAPATTVTTTQKPPVPGPVISTPPRIVTTTVSSKSTPAPVTSTYHPGPGNTGDGGAASTSGLGLLLAGGLLLLIGSGLGIAGLRGGRHGGRP